MKYLKNIEQFIINESVNLYKEIEFVCHNSDFNTSSDEKNQKELYDDLKKLEIESKYSIKPYMQDFSDDDHIEKSLAVIILDKNNEKDLEYKIMRLANLHNIKFDLYNYRTDSQVNSIIRGDYYDNMI